MTGPLALTLMMVDRCASAGGATQSFSVTTLEPDSNSNTVHHNTCLELLVTGHVGAFIELFNLTSRDPDRVGIADDKEKLGLLQLGLSRRDAAVQTGDAGKAYTALTQLGDDFEAKGDLGMARHFRETSLAAAEPLGKATSARAYCALGLVMEKQGKLTGSYEQLQLMRAASEADTSEACSHLVRVSITLADRAEDASDMQGSLEYLTSALALAQEGNEEASITTLRFRLGKAFVALGDAEKAIESLEKYMDSPGSKDDAEGKNRAFEVLATCYEKLGDTDRAANYLERLVETSTRAGQMTIASHASSRLGDIFGSMGKHEQSVHWYNHAFETARDLPDLGWITKCQIQLGRSRAAAMTTGFQDCLGNNKMVDVVRLLMWKSSREDSFSAESSTLGFSKPGTAASKEQSAAVAALAQNAAAAVGGAEGGGDGDEEAAAAEQGGDDAASGNGGDGSGGDGGGGETEAAATASEGGGEAAAAEESAPADADAAAAAAVEAPAADPVADTAPPPAEAPAPADGADGAEGGGDPE